MSNKTDFIRDKINLLENLIQQEEQQRFAQQLIVDDGSTKTGDPELDKAFSTQAANAASVVRACEHRLKSRRAKLDELNAELGQQAAEPA